MTIMSNIVVDADTQVPADVEISNVDESTITDTTTAEDIMDQVAEAVDASEATESSEIPSKFAGKSTEEIIDSYTNLEKELGRKAQEVGELRKLSDSFLQAEVARTKQNPQDNTPLETKDNDVDFSMTLIKRSTI